MIVPLIACVSGASAIGITIFLIRNPDIAEQILEEIKLFFTTGKHKIQIALNNTNELVLRKLDDNGQYLKERIFRSGDQENQEDSRNNPGLNTSTSTSTSTPESNSNDLFYSPDASSVPSSSCITSTSNQFFRENEVDNGESSVRHRRFISPDAPPLPSRPNMNNNNSMFTSFSSSFQRNTSDNHTQAQNTNYSETPYQNGSVTEDDDDDLYQKPKASAILENIPLEFLEREVNRRKMVNAAASMSTSISLAVNSASTASTSTVRPPNVFDDAYCINDESNNISPPPLPPRVPLNDGSQSKPEIGFSSVSNKVPHFEDGPGSYNSSDLLTRRDSVLSCSSIASSSSVLSLSTAGSLTSSWQQFRPSQSSNTNNDFQEYERRMRDQIDDLHNISTSIPRPGSSTNIKNGTLTPTTMNSRASIISREPSLIYSPTPSLGDLSILSAGTTNNLNTSTKDAGSSSRSTRSGKSLGNGSVTSPTSSSSSSFGDLNEENRSVGDYNTGSFIQFDDESASEILTPVTSETSTLECESIIFQSDATEDQMSSDNSLRPRRHVHS